MTKQEIDKWVEEHVLAVGKDAEKDSKIIEAIGFVKYVANKFYNLGKDERLTWEEVEILDKLVVETDLAYMEANMDNDCNYDLEDMYKEVLRKFNEQRHGAETED